MVTDRSRRLVFGLGALFAACLLGGAGRLVTLALPAHADIAAARAEARTRRVLPISARRGSLFDRHGRTLAADIGTLQVEVLPRNIKRRRDGPGEKARLVRKVAAWLAPRLELSTDEVERALAGDRWKRLGKPISDPAILEQLEAASSDLLWGVDLVSGTTRRYPWGAVGGNLIGFVDHEGLGVAGIERGLGDDLLGVNGEREVHSARGTRRLSEPDAVLTPAQNGLDVTLTLDIVIQRAVEEELVAVCTEQEARRAFCAVLDSRTAEVLALASVPGVDLADRSTLDPNGLVLGALQEVYPPGSTLKPLMLATAIDLGLVRSDELVDCRSEQGAIGRRRVRDTHAQDRWLSPREILVHSSNIGMANILTSIVPEDTPRDREAMAPVHAALVGLGFGRSLEMPVPAESAGRVTPLDKWHRSWTLTSVSFGQELSVTALQMAAAVNTLVDGQWRRPSLVRSRRGDDGIERPVLAAEPRVVYPERLAEQVRGWMTDVVSEGACEILSELGVPVAGKTGTADSEVVKGREIHSYTCMVPADDPQLTLVVVVAEPLHARYASGSAAPAAGRILERVLPYLGYDLP